MKSKNVIKVLSAVVLLGTLAGCGKKVTQKDYEKWAKEHGYVQTGGKHLEVSFNTFTDDTTTTNVDESLDNLTPISHNDIKSKLDGGYSFILMWGDKDHECSTCAAYQAALANWVKTNHYTVYYTDYNQGAGATRDELMTTLGIVGGDSYPHLFAVVDGEVVDSFKPANSKDAASKVDSFIKKHFTLETFQANVKKFRNLAELRAEMVRGTEFVLYVTRNSCPDCQKSADILRDDSLTYYFKNFKGNFYEIVSEDVIAEHQSFLTFIDIEPAQDREDLRFPDVSEDTVSSTLALPKDTNPYWKDWSNVQVSEQLIDMTASGVFDTATLGKTPVEFYKTAVAYGKSVYDYVAGSAVLGAYYKSDTTQDYTLIDTQAKLEAAAQEGNPQYFYTKDDGTMFIRSLRSTPTVVAVNYKSVKDVVVSADRTTIYGADGKAVGYKKTVTPTAFAYNAQTGLTYTGTNQVAFRYGKELVQTPAIGGRGAAGAVNEANYLYWYNMNPDNITPRDNNANSVYNTPERIQAIQLRILDWMNSWLVNWAKDKAAA